VNGIHEVSGSIPLGSTNNSTNHIDLIVKFVRSTGSDHIAAHIFFAP
jgi:hypothetical protein